jgi:hypothetical protein
MTKDTKPHICVKCGKEIKPGEEFTHQGKIYCCNNCCKNTQKNPNMCELC